MKGAGYGRGRGRDERVGEVWKKRAKVGGVDEKGRGMGEADRKKALESGKVRGRLRAQSSGSDCPNQFRSLQY